MDEDEIMIEDDAIALEDTKDEIELVEEEEIVDEVVKEQQEVAKQQAEMQGVDISEIKFPKPENLISLPSSKEVLIISKNSSMNSFASRLLRPTSLCITSTSEFLVIVIINFL